MLIHFQDRTARHEYEFIKSFAHSAGKVGWQRVEKPEDAQVSVVWGWDRLIPRQPTVFLEMGWLPRWNYQVSPLGVNVDSHVRSMPDEPVDPLGMRQAADYLWALRSRRPSVTAFNYADPTGFAVSDLPQEFLLAPLQVEGDKNLRHCVTQTMQGFVNRLSKWNPPLPIVFRGHPARIANYDDLEILRPQDRLDLRTATVHQFLKASGCVGVVTLNSNVAHDALIWNRPVVTLERGTWPFDVFTTQLPKDWWTLATDHLYGDREAKRLRYVHRLMQEQWTIDDADNRDRVRQMLNAAWETRESL